MTENVLYVKNEMEEDVEENDEWDDSLLVKAYDKAVSLAKEKIAEKLAAEKADKEKDGVIHENGIATNEGPTSKMRTSNSKQSKVRRWKAGNNCRAEYSVDGREYEAVITSIDHNEGICTVKFLGYGNVEEVEIRNLQPSHGPEAQQSQKYEAQQSGAYADYSQPQYGQSQDYSCDSSQPFPQTSGVIPPPPPPFVMATLPKDETDALSAMLMSWYMSGYHTGYYQGLTRSRMAEKERNCPSYRSGR